MFIVFAVVVSSVSCSEEQDKKVDQQYLNSQEYSSFKKNTNEELKSNDHSENLANDLVEISDCSFSAALQSPFSLDWEVLEGLKAKAESCHLEEENQRLTLVGIQSLEQQTVRWFLLEHPSAYRDAEVIVATFSGKELRSFNTVGIYEQIPARSIQTDITVNSRGSNIFIRSKTIRDIKYPLEQKNTITAEYEIDAEGGINEL